MTSDLKHVVDHFSVALWADHFLQLLLLFCHFIQILLLVGEPPVLVVVAEGVPHPQTDLDLIDGKH